MQSPTSPSPLNPSLEESYPDSPEPRGQEAHVHVEHALPHAGENRSDTLPPSSYMPPSEPEPSTPKATFTTNIRPYSASGVPSPPRSVASTTRPTAGPSISTRTSFTRVETEDEQARQTPFPARPATASAASSSAGAFGFGFGIFGGGYGGYSRYGGNGKERLTDVVSTGGSGEGGDNEYDDEDAQEQEQEQGRDKSLGVRAPSPSPSTGTPPDQDQQPDSIAEAPAPASMQAPVPQDPQAYITFLLMTGCRRTMSFEPETAVGRVKELVWNTWPEDEEWKKDRPPAPSYLRLLYLGRLLQDDDTLIKLKIPLSQPTYPQPTIVHLSIRPYAPPNGTENSENLNKKMGRLRRLRSGDDADGSSWNCCRCIIC